MHEHGGNSRACAPEVLQRGASTSTLSWVTRDGDDGVSKLLTFLHAKEPIRGEA